MDLDTINRTIPQDMHLMIIILMDLDLVIITIPQDMHLMGHYGWASGWGALEPGSRLRPKTLQVENPMLRLHCQHRSLAINIINIIIIININSVIVVAQHSLPRKERRRSGN